MRADVLANTVRTLGRGVVARARALTTPGPSSQSEPGRSAMSAYKRPGDQLRKSMKTRRERNGADWQGINEPSARAHAEYSMGAIRAGCRHAIQMNDASHVLTIEWQLPVGRILLLLLLLLLLPIGMIRMPKFIVWAVSPRGQTDRQTGSQAGGRQCSTKPLF